MSLGIYIGLNFFHICIPKITGTFLKKARWPFFGRKILAYFLVFRILKVICNGRGGHGKKMGVDGFPLEKTTPPALKTRDF